MFVYSIFMIVFNWCSCVLHTCRLHWRSYCTMIRNSVQINSLTFLLIKISTVREVLKFVNIWWKWLQVYNVSHMWLWSNCLFIHLFILFDSDSIAHKTQEHIYIHTQTHTSFYYAFSENCILLFVAVPIFVALVIRLYLEPTCISTVLRQWFAVFGTSLLLEHQLKKSRYRSTCRGHSHPNPLIPRRSVCQWLQRLLHNWRCHWHLSAAGIDTISVRQQNPFATKTPNDTTILQWALAGDEIARA